MRHNLIWATLIALSLFTVSDAKADLVLFDFRQDDADDPATMAVAEFDGGGVGASATIDGLTLTTVDILTPEITDPDGDGVYSATGVIFSAAAGQGGATNIAGNQDALGINSAVSNGDFDTLGAGTESGDFNPNESWVFRFDQDIEFNTLEFESVVNVDILNVFVDGTLIQTFNGNFDGNTTGVDLGALDGLTIAAGSEITFGIDGVNVPEAIDDADNPSTSVRLESFTVHAKAVPEPSSLLALVGIAGLATVRRRR